MISDPKIYQIYRVLLVFEGFFLVATVRETQTKFYCSIFGNCLNEWLVSLSQWHNLIYKKQSINFESKRYN